MSELYEDLLAMLDTLFSDMDESPSATFTYAMLNELSRLAEIFAADENGLPEELMKVYLTIAGEYKSLRHFSFAKDYYLKTIEVFQKYRNDIFDDVGAIKIFKESCMYLLKIYGYMDNREAADRISDLLRDAFPKEYNEIYKKAMSPSTFLYDTVEYTDEYLAILPELEIKIEAALKGVKQGHGFCFQYWRVKKEILKRDYGIEWVSPNVLNPHIRFD